MFLRNDYLIYAGIKLNLYLFCAGFDELTLYYFMQVTCIQFTQDEIEHVSILQRVRKYYVLLYLGLVNKDFEDAVEKLEK